MAVAQHDFAGSPVDLPTWPATDLHELLNDPESVFRQFQTATIAQSSGPGHQFDVRLRGPGVFELTLGGPSFVGRQIVCQLGTGLGLVASAYTRVPALRNHLSGDRLILIQLPLVGLAVHDTAVPWPDTMAAMNYLAPGSKFPFNVTRAGAWQTMALFGTLLGFQRKWGLGKEIAAALGHSTGSLRRCPQFLRRPWPMTRGAVELVLDVLNNQMCGRLARAYIEARSHQLLCECLAALSNVTPTNVLPGRTRKLLQLARELIISDPAQRHTLRNLAQSVGLNRTLLAEGFHIEFGQTVFDFLQHERLKRAWTLIESSHESVSTVATQVGYRDSSSFSRAFKARFGVSPRQVREGTVRQVYENRRMRHPKCASANTNPVQSTPTPRTSR